jgi:DNA ligase D-like protein (predicted 3'-phosphoesterase)
MEMAGKSSNRKDSGDSLEKYREKRDFRKTGEPSGEKAASTGKTVFVIQKHDARRLHYDLRLEVDGVLASWAVPKGPSTDPAEKRLAVRTEDHPLEYADFEGVIPEGEYGAGTMIVWDQGTYRNRREEKPKDKDRKTMAQSLEDGKVEIWLQGEKLKGGYNLIRTKYGDSDEDNWLLMKAKDSEADARRNPVSTQPESVKSGKTIEQLAGEE